MFEVLGIVWEIGALPGAARFIPWLAISLSRALSLTEPLDEPRSPEEKVAPILCASLWRLRLRASMCGRNETASSRSFTEQRRSCLQSLQETVVLPANSQLAGAYV